MNPKGLNTNLEDKMKFYSIMSKKNIKTPEILASNEKMNFSFNENKKFIENNDEFISFIHKLIGASANNSIFIKPIDGIGGQSIFRVKEFDLNKLDYIEGIFQTIKEGNYIYQETIEQHHLLNTIYPHSINTVRIHTYHDKQTDQVLLTSALIRIGASGSIIDNENLFIPLDINSWRLSEVGRSFLKNGAKTYYRHPDSDIKFDNIFLPHGEMIKNEVINAARLFENAFVGWDVAITNNGPTIIEGNGNPHLIMTQIASNGFRNHPLYSDIFRDYLY